MLVGLIYAAAHFQRNTGYKLKVQWHVLHLKCVCVCVCPVVCFFSLCETPSSVTSSSHKSPVLGFSFRGEPSRCQTIRISQLSGHRCKHTPTQPSWFSLVCQGTGVFVQQCQSVTHRQSVEPTQQKQTPSSIVQPSPAAERRLKPDRHQMTWQSFLSPDHIELWLLYSAVGGWTLPLLLIPKNYVSLIVLM